MVRKVVGWKISLKNNVFKDSSYSRWDIPTESYIEKKSWVLVKDNVGQSET